MKPLQTRKKIFISLGVIVITLLAVIIVLFIFDRKGQNNRWPKRLYPQLPVFEASSYGVETANKQTIISVPSDEAANLSDYLTTLLEAGGRLLADNTFTYAVAFENYELHIVTDNATPSIIICNEPQMTFDTSDFANCPLPAEGRLVSVTEVSEGTDVQLIYRNVTITGLNNYIADLIAKGWVTDSTPVPVSGQAFLGSYIQGIYTLTIDYYANTSDFVIHLNRIAQG